VAIEPDPDLEEKLTAELKGEFSIERVLGRGGMGTVFLARDLQLSRNVAIKVLPPELTYGPGMVERFKREARTAATLDHPHIVPIYRISSTGKIVWFVMKYVDGETLADALDRAKVLPPSRVVSIVGQVAEALEFAHRRGVIHRDVKPSNIMLGAEDWVTVTDFGIAKATGLEPLTGSGAMIGTPFYMSPEQCAGKAQLTGASDQYSLGVMAYQMLSGRLPFVGESTIDVIKQQCFDPPPPLDSLRPGLPPRLVAAVQRALRKEPGQRSPGHRH
jgi:serine/threonine protein kinase